jgi:tRNA pseudouridine65 synthase
MCDDKYTGEVCTIVHRWCYVYSWMISPKLRILYQDEHLVVVDKPAGFQVHTPEHLAREGKVLARNNVMLILRDQLGKWIFPVHRLDRATSGVLLFAFSSEVASALQQKFKNREIQKRYFALVRGWTNAEQIIDSPLTTRLDGGAEVEARTEFKKLAQFELLQAIGPYPTARYSLLAISLPTGRLHQIRRHLKLIFHPVVGDTVHGDGKHNQWWRAQAKQKFLYLKAYSLKFNHPVTGEKIYVHSRWNRPWQEVFDLAQFCPYFTSENE